jgi:hypothetical protein
MLSSLKEIVELLSQATQAKVAAQSNQFSSLKRTFWNVEFTDMITLKNIKLSVSRTHHKSSFLRAPTEHN